MRRLLLLVLAAIGCGSGARSPRDAWSPDAADAAVDAPGDAMPVTRNGLVGEWLFAGNAADTSGKGHNGTVNGAAPIEDRFGRPQAAYHFDGVSTAVEIPTATDLALTTDLTISAWIKPDAARGLVGIVSKYQEFADNGYTLRLGYLAPYTYYDFDETSRLDTVPPPPTVVLGEWQHVAVVVHTGKATIYVNGVAGAAATPGYAIIANTHPLRIGVDFTSRYFVGGIDDVRLYSRALAAGEIAGLYGERP
jgi:hypothetical protein